ncbi:MAG: hypothetical protein ACI8ZB_004856 [Desulforhopalus sp.]|jgi:hypothetical protein
MLSEEAGMSKEKKKSTSLRLDAKVLKDLKMLAVENETSIQAIVESLVKEYIEKNKPRR